MAHSTDLQLELIATGEKAGLWGTITNNNLKILELASTGLYQIDIAAADLVLTLDAGSALGSSTATGKNLYIKLTGNLIANRTVTMPVTAERVFIIEDATNRAPAGTNYTITVLTVGSAVTPISLPIGSTSLLYSNGTDMLSGGLLGQGHVTITGGTNSPYTAVAGDEIFANVTTAVVQILLPASPVQGDQVTIMDGSTTGGFLTNNCTISRNGNPINGLASDVVLAINDQALTLIYSNATKGWIYKSTNQ